MNGDDLNPLAPAESITAGRFAGAAGFRVVAAEPGHAEPALARRDDLVQLFGRFHGEAVTAPADQVVHPCAFCIATPRSLDPPAETQ